MSKQIEITLEQAKELLVTTPSLKDVIHSNFPELKPSIVPDSFKGLGSISGYYIESASHLSYQRDITSSNHNRNVFKTEKQAQSALAMAQLSQLMAATGDCDIDWSDEKPRKYYIYSIIKNDGSVNLDISFHHSFKIFLAFNTKKIAEEFLTKHYELIKQYYNY